MSSTIQALIQSAGILLALVFLLLTEVLAQGITVKGADGQVPLELAHITLQSLDGSQKDVVLLTDENGFASTSKYASGSSYIVHVSLLGFKSKVDTTSLENHLVYFLLPLDISLNEVVITAQYAPNSPEKSVHKVKIISQEKIEQMAATNLEDVLTNELNIRLSQDNILGSSLSMQGISGENVKVMIDGVPIIGRQAGNIDLSQINLNNVAQIEVIEGPLSVNYGTNALAGTINIITKKTSINKWEYSLSSYNENIGTYNLSAQVGAKLGVGHLNVSGGRNFFDGWKEPDRFLDDFKQPIADTTRTKQWKPKTQYFGRLQYDYQIKDLKLGYKGELFKEKITNRGFPRAPYFETAFDDYYYTNRLDNAIYLNGKVRNKDYVQFIAAYNRFKRTKNTYIKDLTTLDEQLTATPGDQDTSRFDLWMARGSFATNEHSIVNYELGFDLASESTRGQRIEDLEQDMTDLAFFISSEIKPLGKSSLDRNADLIIRLGLRYGYNNAYRQPLIPSLHMKWQQKDFSFRASYARGFRAPSLKELFFLFVDINHDIVGNPNLKAEYANNYAATLTYQKEIERKLIKTELSSYFNGIQNLITLAQTTGTQYSYINIGEYKTTGMSLNIGMAVEHLKLSVSGGFVGRYSVLSKARKSGSFIYYPEARANFTYDWKRAGINIAAFYKYQGRLPGYVLVDDEIEETFIDDYHLLDVTVSRDFWKDRIGLALGMKNLLNVTNVQSALSGGVHSGSSVSVPVSTGRVLFLKLDLKFSKR